MSVMACRGGGVVAALFLLVMVSLSLTMGANPQTMEVTLCDEVHGFAGEYNDHFNIKIPHSPQDEKQAVVFVARAFPVTQGAMSQTWISFNATYVNEKGAKTVTSSDNNGILRITSISADAVVEVWVTRQRLDGPAPFRFFSYLSGYPSCFIPVSPSNSFVGLIPRVVREGGSNAAIIYFQTTLPKDLNAFIVKDAGTGGNTGVLVLSEDGNKWEPHAAGEAIVRAPEKIVKFYYQPSTSSADPFVFLYLTVEYTRGDGGGDKGGETSAAPDTGSPLPDSDKKKTSYTGLRGFLTLLCYALILLVVYLVAGSYYNYSRNGLQEFPEMIPHVDFFRSCMVGCLSFGNSIRPSQRYGGYSSVRGGEMDNPYNL